MTPEELDEERAKEAYRLWAAVESRVGEMSSAQVAARLAREGWTPPAPVDPDILAFREWYSSQWGDVLEVLRGRSAKSAILAGASDNTDFAKAFLAGARMAREKEGERTQLLVRELREISDMARAALGEDGEKRDD